MRAIQQNRPFGHFLDRIDKRHAHRREAIHDITIVDDFVIDIDIRAEALDNHIERGDRHVDAGAKAAGIGEEDLHLGDWEFGIWGRGRRDDEGIIRNCWRSGESDGGIGRFGGVYSAGLAQVVGGRGIDMMW